MSRLGSGRHGRKLYGLQNSTYGQSGMKITAWEWWYTKICYYQCSQTRMTAILALPMQSDLYADALLVICPTASRDIVKLLRQA